ncbi:epoxide hydrolase family protein [Streptomyces sp. NP160]|uniref:epoxide hydrolase family protein n=1 Tax=Streptomyces sp. NP160 TaxID=2586637 RepID=UPI001C58ECD3|nr:epoxide hydrolase family protein [Streptomyces sp. NP160]
MPTTRLPTDDGSAGDVRPFSIDVTRAAQDDLRTRLSSARLLPASPARPPSALDATYLAELVSAWRNFDWPARQRWLNTHPQVLVDLGDVAVHAVHQPSADPHAPALLMMHGWPHTFALQLDFADLLPDFHVVVASLPGFTFSSPYRHGPQTHARLAQTMHQLMGALGHQRYLTYGEDVSAPVNDLLAATHPEAVLGVIATHAHFPDLAERARLADPATDAFFARLADQRHAFAGYAHQQGTRPDTLAVALNDSPAGLLAWIVEKLAEWSDTPDEVPGGVEQRLSRERILTEVSLYWFTQCIATSFRPYYEQVTDPQVAPPVLVPAAVHVQRHELDYPEAAARAHYRDLRVFERLAEGGHFTVAEVPQAMADRVRTFAASLDL